MNLGVQVGVKPLVSVVIETITARYDAVTVGSMAEDLARTLTALERQTYPRDRMDVIVVVDPAVARTAADEVAARYAFVRLAESQTDNYCAAKNAGAQVARGDLVALLDGDCEPADQWLERLVARFDVDVDVVAGRTRYEMGTRRARALSVIDFAHVLGDESGQASGFNINNVAFRRKVLHEHPLEPRIRRNGGCTLLYHQLAAAGKQMVYEPGARVSHGDGDISGLHFLRKHFGRGFDSVDVYRFDTTGVLRGSRLVNRFGTPVLLGITVRRIGVDWRRLVRQRHQAGISLLAVPYVAVVGALLRTVELAGMLTNRTGRRGYGSHGPPDGQRT